VYVLIYAGTDSTFTAFTSWEKGKVMPEGEFYGNED